MGLYASTLILLDQYCRLESRNAGNQHDADTQLLELAIATRNLGLKWALRCPFSHDLTNMGIHPPPDDVDSERLTETFDLALSGAIEDSRPNLQA